ncbi:MAG: nuclear transport factor 2 family protein [Labilithrix sp.]|nr:nuclear transport factor 2 family protein [Labilithrix sp.]
MPLAPLGLQLPAPVAAAIDAVNAGDASALLALFAEDAMVNDQLREHWGRATIAGWIARDVVGQRLSMRIGRVRNNHAHAVVEATVDGDFERRGLPDPLVVTFYFSVHAGQIDQLLILRNEPSD